MANTYTQIHIQFVFAVKYRSALIHRSWKDRLHRFITAMVQKRGHKMLQINSEPDHIHMLVGMRPHQDMSSLMQIIKSESTLKINDNKLCPGKFAWQEGFGAFSYSKKDVPNVIRYIQNQQKHHAKKTFRQEYVELLEKFGVDYDPRYIFKTMYDDSAAP